MHPLQAGAGEPGRAEAVHAGGEEVEPRRHGGAAVRQAVCQSPLLHLERRAGPALLLRPHY